MATLRARGCQRSSTRPKRPTRSRARRFKGTRFGLPTFQRPATWLITNHSQYDNSWLKAHTAQDRKPGDPSPFDVGTASVANYFTALQSCVQAAKLRATGSL